MSKRLDKYEHLEELDLLSRIEEHHKLTKQQKDKRKRKAKDSSFESKWK